MLLHMITLDVLHCQPVSTTFVLNSKSPPLDLTLWTPNGTGSVFFESMTNVRFENFCGREDSVFKCGLDRLHELYGWPNFMELLCP